MKNFLPIVILLLVSQLTVAQLSGQYTIGGSSPNYSTIQTAVNALHSQGTSAPVEFLIRNGTYNDQITVNDFTRTGNPTDTVTFRKSSPVGIVNWEYNAQGASSNWVLRLDGAKYITVRGITFNAVSANNFDLIHIRGGAANNIFELCDFNGVFSQGNLILQSGTGNQPNHIFRNNSFLFGNKAIDFNYLFGGADSRGLQIIGNTFSGQNSSAVESGTINIWVMDNTVYATTVSGSGYIGLDIDDFSPVIENNVIDMTKGDSAIWLRREQGVALEARIVNNLISVRSSTASRGIYVRSSNTSVYHNTVRMRSANGPALWISGGVLEDVRINNNILINDASAAGGLALRLDDAVVISDSNNNDLYTTGAVLVRSNNLNYNNLTTYSAATGFDLDSVSKNVSFVQTTGLNDLHLSSPSNADTELLAPVLASVNLDVDGDPRGTYTAFKGADEGIISLSPLDNTDTANGYYTVGGFAPDFANPNEAITGLKQRGMNGPVTFRVRAGNYVVHQTLSDIIRLDNSDDLILFRADSISNPPAFNHAATNDNDNWVIKIQDTDYVGFLYIDFTSTSSGQYGRLIDLEGETNNIVISNSVMTGLTGQTSNTAALVFSDDRGRDNLTFEKNTYIDGSIAISMIPPNPFSSPTGTGINILESLFRNQRVYSLITNYNGLVFEDNEIISSHNDMLSLYIRFNVDNKISRNKFHLTGNNTTAIELNGADGGQLVDPSIVANNFIVASSGLELNTGSLNTHIYFNSIVATQSPLTISYQMIPNNSKAIKLVNNILFNNGSGAALTVAQDVDITEINHNNFLNATPSLIDWEGVSYTSLASYQTATGNDLNSTTTPVSFANLVNGDLHLVNSSINNMGLLGKPVNFVNNDYDLELRPNSGPYMGADEVAGSPLVTEFLIGGTVTGLTSGSIDIDNVNGDFLNNLTNGDFTFPIFLFDTAFYEVLIVNQPAVADLTCSIVNSSGNIQGQNVTDIEINCNSEEMFSNGFE